MAPIPFALKKRLPLLAFLFFYLLFSFFTFRDYGCTWDEEDAYQGGAVLYDYLIHGVSPRYLEPDHAYPYPFFLRLFLTQPNYNLFHLLNLLSAVLLFAALYEVLLRATGLPWASLLGPLFLFLCSPFLGSIPANPKDIPFAWGYFLGLAALFLLERAKYRWVWLGIVFGFAMTSRIVGFTLFPVLLLYDYYLFRNFPSGKGKPVQMGKWLKEKLLEWFGVLALSQIFCVIFWPYLGAHYFSNLPRVFGLSAGFPPNFGFLFMGGMSDSKSYPWFYLPVMMGITLPLFLLVLFLASSLLYKTWKTNKLYVLMGGTFIFNFVLYLLLRPAVYDGLRHFLYLIPILATLAALACIPYLRKPLFLPVKTIMGLVLMLGMGTTVIQMVKLHPYEYLYYNELAGGFKGAYGKYETDYWVAGMREAVEWLKANEIKDPKRIYKIRAQGKPFQSKTYFSFNMVFAEPKEDADYSILMTRAGLKPAPKDEGKIIHRVERDGTPLVFVLKLH